MSPRQALRDPDLAFGLTVMRGHDAHRAERLRRVIKAVKQAAGKKDAFGLSPILTALSLLYEDG